MFDLTSINLTNFRSYVGQHTFTFPTAPGLYSLTGSNLANPRLASNDVGKTTLLEALFWCLYGKTTRGLRASDIISWGEKTAQVSVGAQIGNATHTIRRTQSPNSLNLNTVTVTQETLEKTLRVGPDEFIYSVLLPQFGNCFFDLGPAEKLNLFSNILGLEYWLGKSKLAGELAEELLREKAASEREVIKVTARLETIAGVLKEYNQKHVVFEANQKAIIRDLIARRKKGKDAISDCKYKFAQNQVALENIRKKLEAIDIKCPACNQPLQSGSITTLKRNQEDYKADLHRCERQMSAAQAELESLERNIEEEKTRVSPYEQMAKEKALEVGSLKRELTKHAQALNQCTADHAAMDFWVAGFKRVRLYVVEATLRQLEVEVNNSLTSLGLVDWRVGFDIERETKGGGISRGFSVFIYPPDRNDPVRWEAFGGGATQRLRLAGNLGLANLIMERAGLRNQVEFYDEPSHHMSDEGISDLLTMLQERAISEGKKCWVIDHHSLDYPFDGQVVVTKDASGSHLTFGKQM